MKNRSIHTAFFIGTLAGGGAERVILNIADEFVQRGLKVDLLLTRFKGPLVNDVPSGVNVVELEKCSWLYTSKYLFRLPMRDWVDILLMVANRRPKVVRRLPSLLKYLNDSKPDSLLSTLDSVNVTALWAKHLSDIETKFIIRQAIFQSQEISNSDKYFESRLLPKFVKRWYLTADRIIAVSEEMKKDLTKYCCLPSSNVTTIYNPVNLKRIEECNKEGLDDPWIQDEKLPIVLAVGRLDRQKDYPTLLKAIKFVNDEKKVKLIILGEGPDRALLESTLKDLNICERVKLPGYVSNPYKYMHRSDVFVLSSKWEGLPNVLIEALACGCNIVSTDCPSGPRELLENGRLGRLVEVGNAKQLAQCILTVLNEKNTSKGKINLAEKYSIYPIAEKYFDILSGS